MGKAASDATRRYKEKAYDRISLEVKKDKKEKYRAAAKVNNLTLQGLIKQLLEEFCEKNSK